MDIQALREDNIHGASFLAREAVLIMKKAASSSHTADAVKFRHQMQYLGVMLMKSRPDMALIYNLINCLMKRYEQVDQTTPCVKIVRQQFLKLADQILEEWTDARRKAIARAVQWVADQSTIVTCSYSSTVCEVLLEAGRSGHYPRILVLNSKMSDHAPAYGQLTRQELDKHRIACQVLPDQALQEAAAQADTVILGADSILADGSLINGFPSRSLGFAAHGLGIPLYPVCETYRFIDRTPPLKLTEGFELLGPELITRIFTEKGPLPPARVQEFIIPPFKPF